MNKYDIYKWVDSVIKSCKTLSQLRSAINLVNNFKINIGDDICVNALEKTIRLKRRRLDPNY